MNPMMQMGGMPPMAPPQPPTTEQLALLKKPSWEQIEQLLRDKVHCAYRIDIETDSTIAGSLDADMQGMAEVMQAVSGFLQQSMPMVQSGMLPMDAEKSMLMAIVRRAKMGNEVEDALDNMTAPRPNQQPDPSVQVQQLKMQDNAQRFQAEQAANEREAQRTMQMEQMQLQAEMQARQFEAQLAQQTEANKQEMQAREEAHRNQLEAQRAQMQAAFEAQARQFEAMMAQQNRQANERLQIALQQMKNANAIEVAEVNQAGQLQRQQVAAANTAAQDMGIQGLADQPIQPKPQVQP